MERAFTSDARFLPGWATRNLQGQHQNGEQQRLESYGKSTYISLEEWKRCSGYYTVHEDEDDAVSVASEELYRPRTPEAQLVTITDKPSRGTFFPEMEESWLHQSRHQGFAQVSAITVEGNSEEGSTISQAHFSELGKPRRARGYFCPELSEGIQSVVFIPELSAAEKQEPHIVIRSSTGYPPPPWMALPWKEKAKVSLSLPLLRAEGGDEEAQVGLEATDADSRSGGLAVAARYCLFVNVNRGLHSGDVIQQRRTKKKRPAVSATTGRKAT